MTSTEGRVESIACEVVLFFRTVFSMARKLLDSGIQRGSLAA